VKPDHGAGAVGAAHAALLYQTDLQSTAVWYLQAIAAAQAIAARLAAQASGVPAVPSQLPSSSFNQAPPPATLQQPAMFQQSPAFQQPNSLPPPPSAAQSMAHPGVSSSVAAAQAIADRLAAQHGSADEQPVSWNKAAPPNLYQQQTWLPPPPASAAAFSATGSSNSSIQDSISVAQAIANRLAAQAAAQGQYQPPG
jgi:hypothetical protein